VSSWNALYFQGDLPAELRLPFAGRATVRRVGRWTAVEFPPLLNLKPIALELSEAAQTQVIWAMLQTTASVVQLIHCHAGQVARCLSFADGEWREIEGQPQSWESWLFRDEARQDAIDILSEDDDPSEVEAVFAKRELTVGRSIPWPNEWDMVFAGLGVSHAEWQATRRDPPVSTIEGTQVLLSTVVARPALGVTLGLALIGGLGYRPAFGVAVLSFCLAIASTLVRKAVLGRWLR
jgi:hypothetical protein